MKPRLIYWSVIKPDDSIETRLFPDGDAGQLVALAPLEEYASSDTLTDEAIEELADLKRVSFEGADLPKAKRKRRSALLKMIQDRRIEESWDDASLADDLARVIYRDLVSDHAEWTKGFAPDL